MLIRSHGDKRVVACGAPQHPRVERWAVSGEHLCFELSTSDLGALGYPVVTAAIPMEELGAMMRAATEARIAKLREEKAAARVAAQRDLSSP